VLNDDTFRSLEGKSKHQLWLELCDIITKHPREVAGIRVDAILRGGIRRFTDEVRRGGGGASWCWCWAGAVWAVWIGGRRCRSIKLPAAGRKRK
jgi:hypothetical protein